MEAYLGSLEWSEGWREPPLICVGRHVEVKDSGTGERWRGVICNIKAPVSSSFPALVETQFDANVASLVSEEEEQDLPFMIRGQKSLKDTSRQSLLEERLVCRNGGIFASCDWSTLGKPSPVLEGMKLVAVRAKPVGASLGSVGEQLGRGGQLTFLPASASSKCTDCALLVEATHTAQLRLAWCCSKDVQVLPQEDDEPIAVDPDDPLCWNPLRALWHAAKAVQQLPRADLRRQERF
mmetsp:Transcript_25639/g.48485  ORF Transcript_25639/g.48485 Transcript_25639/m.48485 type:complete len:237 (+) Transcript_25639:2951-3661(+)